MQPKIYLIGIGMGNPNTLTIEGKMAVDCCDVLIGAPRLLKTLTRKICPKFALIDPKDILKCIKSQKNFIKIGVLLSGDVGFYSGAKALYSMLKDYSIETICGISSPAYFCAKLGIAWSDVYLLSAHGQDCNILGAVQNHAKTFLLTGGQWTAQRVCDELVQRGLGYIKVSVGVNLSYPQEQIITGTALELSLQSFANLAVMLISNPHPIIKPGTISIEIPDEEFKRDAKVPMTKAEVRNLSLARLGLQSCDTFWDVGAGTGSVAISGAFLAREGRVFAIEKDPLALSIIEDNKQKFGVRHLTIIPGAAPEALDPLPKPNCVFIGGSNGQLKRIITKVIDKNPKVRLVINAITLETLNEAITCCKELNLKNFQIKQVFIVKAKEVSNHQLMNSQNPVFIISGEGNDEY